VDNKLTAHRVNRFGIVLNFANTPQVWCSWFCALTDGISKTLGGNKNVNAYGVWSNGEKAGTPIVQGAKPLIAKNGGKFLADLDM
jgi:hypothetical protein